MRRLSDIISRLSYSVALLAAVLLSACSSDDATNTEEPLPDGMGRLQVTVTTRAVTEDPSEPAVHENPWETPDHEWEVMHSLRVIICKASDNTVVQIKEVDDDDINHSVPATPPAAAHNQTDYKYSSPVTVISDPLPVGSYHVFATANYDDGYTVGEVVDLNRTERFPFGLSQASDDYSEVAASTIPFGAKRNIPMTGKLIENNALKSVSVTASSTPTEAGTLTIWRVIGKMQFEFTNEASEEIQIMGIEVEPIHLASSSGPGIYLFSHDDLTLTDDLEWGDGTTNPGSGKEYLILPPQGTCAKSAREDVGPVKYETSTTTPLLTLAAKNDGDTDEGTLFFYVNETDATFTMFQNQYSLRFKIKRGGTINELRYGVTTQWDKTNGGGFNVIRRNDWIHIPIRLTDWQYRIEPLPFVPIGGYPAATVSSDGLTATFSTGGMIALQPFIKKRNDASWRDFGYTDISYGDASWAASIHWKNKDGIDESGDNCIVKTAFAYDPDSKSIIGELNNDPDILGNNYMTTFTVHLKLKGPKVSDDPETYVWYDYTFTFNIVLQ